MFFVVTAVETSDHAKGRRRNGGKSWRLSVCSGLRRFCCVSTKAVLLLSVAWILRLITEFKRGTWTGDAEDIRTYWVGGEVKG
jgi:hypothetical protein